MFRKTTGIGLAALTVAGSAIAVAPAAEAATCAVGRWKATSAVLDQAGQGRHAVGTGLGGVVLKIGASGRLVYNYSKSKPLVVRSLVSNQPLAAVAVYNKILREQAVVSGGKHGTFTASPSTATGDATVTVTYTKPGPAVYHDSVVALVKAGRFFSPVPSAGSFTCSARKLHLHEQITQNGFLTVGDWWYRRL